MAKTDVVVYIYLDHSNIFLGAQPMAQQLEGYDTRYRVRLDFANLLTLAHCHRPVRRTVAAGSISPALERLWGRLQDRSAKVELLHRHGHGEQQHPDIQLQLSMLQDTLDNDPGVVVLLTGDGLGYVNDEGFHENLERMHQKGWRVKKNCPTN